MARTPKEIHEAGLDALVRAHGPVDAIRFLQYYDNGSGDYSTERHQWLDSLTLDEIADAIEERRRRAGTEGTADGSD